MLPRVTVVIATFNRSEVLRCAIASVLLQTFSEFELLVAGDGCTDDSEQVVASFGDDRVRWINLPQNSGHQSAPNNEGLRQARGEIIAYLGHDDLWLPHHLAAHVRAFDTTGCELAYSLCMLVAPDGSSWPAVSRPRRMAYGPPSCITHRRTVTESIGQWKDYRTLDQADGTPDIELWRRAAKHGLGFEFVRRLTAIKFPAAWRRNAYRTHSADEQQQWLQRIEADPNIEATVLVNSVVADHLPSGIGYLDLMRTMVQQTISRVRRRMALPSFIRRNPAGRTIDELRRYKGL